MISKKISRYFVCLIGIVLIAWLTTACGGIATIAPSDFPYYLMLSTDDLPADWARTGGSFPTVEGADITHLVAYSPQQEVNWKFISHQVAVYPDAESAASAYPDWEAEWFNDYWSPWDEGTFTPANAEDLFRYECMGTKINGAPIISCRYLQLHENMIVLVITNIDGQDITFEVLNDTLLNLDDKLQDGATETP